MPQALVVLCHLANIIDSTLCREEEKIKDNGKEWPCAISAGSHVQYAVVATVHLSFLLSVIVLKFQNKRKTYQSFHTPKLFGAWRSGHTFGSWYNATLGSCILLCLSHLTLVIWGVIYHRKKGWSCFAMAESVELVQVIAWSSIATGTACVKLERKKTFPSIIRAWWIASFFIAAWAFIPSLHLLTKYWRAPVTAWVEILTFPLYVFLCIVAINGKTGFGKVTLEVLLEPLVNEPSQKTITSERISKYATAGFLSLALFSWLDPLLSVGYRKPLELDDIPQLAPADTATETFGILSMNRENNEAKSLYQCLVQTFWKATVVNGCFAALNTCALYVGPYLINDFVEYLAGRQQVGKEGYVLAVVFFGAKVVETLAQRQWYFGSQQLSLRVTAGLTGLIYRKGLSLSNYSRQSHTSGEIINYMSVDIQRISDFYEYLHELWLMPIQICLALVILYKSLGIASLAAFGATVLVLITNIPLSTVLEKFQNKIMMAKDDRMKATTEVLRGMKIIKLQAWEMKYLKKLETLRNLEYRWIFRFCYTRSFVVTVYWVAPTIVSIVSFCTSVLFGIPLTAGKVLSALAAFRILQAPIYNLPDVVTMLSQTRISLGRLSKFLKEQEVQLDAITRSQSNTDHMAIEISDAGFSWNGLQGPTLTVSQLHIKKGLRVAVCGMVGSGKSSLLSCILGEIPRLSGFAKVNGTRAYVAQSAWIQSGNIQDNILFGKPLDRTKYEEVLHICALTKDLELFSHGDQTEIGERGINLSGGQKQRIQLARAIYQDADIYLLDDPFSAVDAHTGTHLFKECILGALQNKTVVYVTHQIEFLPAADLILVLQNGSIVQAGNFDDLLQAGSNFSILIRAHSTALKSVECLKSSSTSEEMTTRSNDATVDTANIYTNHLQENSDAGMQDQKALTQIVQEEDRETGCVSMAVYWSLVSAAYGGALVPVILLCQTLFQSLQIASNYWMAWATPFVYDRNQTISRFDLLLVYISLGAAGALCILIRALLVSTVALVAAQKFFVNMLRCIFQAPMSFFDSTPTGRILNRASADQSALDQEVTQRFAGLAFNIIQLIGVVVVMSQVAWQVFALFIPMLGLCFWLQRYYIASARELSRLVGIRKSPIIHHFGESLAGATTIRGFDQESRFMEMILHLIDCYSRPLFNNFAAMEWLCLRLNLLTDVIFAFSLLLIVSLPVDAVNASIAGLSVTYAFTLSVLQNSVVWNLCHLENKIISVERIQQYTCIPSEAPLILENCRPPTDWPTDGAISFKNLQVRYAPRMPLVLHGITCTFSGGSKIGVVGRTGSGKSTLIQALFRIVEPAAGTVVIDGIDILRIGLHDLRSKLSIIPQDPTMFEGSLRSNLDPLEEYTDSEVWEVIDKSQLGDVVRSNDQKLDSLVTENGENWSVGQRQLVCLGRALLKRSRILVLDEATASVDTATDGVIQETVRTEFQNCTVVTIAHRIPTVIDSDGVLVLKDGRIGEFDSPASLLEDRSSLFAKLVSEYTTRSTRVNESQ